MTKDVLISISGLQMDVLEEEKSMNLLKSLLLLTISSKMENITFYSMKLQRVYRALQKIE